MQARVKGKKENVKTYDWNVPSDVDILRWEPTIPPSLHSQNETDNSEGCEGGCCRKIYPDGIPSTPVKSIPTKKKRAASRTLRTTHRNRRLDAIFGHIRDGHRGYQARLAAYNTGFFSNMPKPVDLDHDCIICWITRSNRIPRGLSVDWAKIRPGVRFHVDYWFANIPSLRGNTACLSIVEGKTSVMVQIPVKSKRPPVKIFQRIIKICRRAGLPFSEVRVDEVLRKLAFQEGDYFYYMYK